MYCQTIVDQVWFKTFLCPVRNIASRLKFGKQIKQISESVSVLRLIRTEMHTNHYMKVSSKTLDKL